MRSSWISIGLILIGLTIVSNAFPISFELTDRRRQQIQSVLDSNKSRRDVSRITTAFVLLFVSLGMMSLTILLSILLTWLWQPLKSILNKKTSQPELVTKIHTVIWALILLIVNFIVSGFGGLPGWMVIGFLYFSTTICIIVVVIVVQCQTRRRVVHLDDVNGDPELAAELQKHIQTTQWSTHPLPYGKKQLLASWICGALILLFFAAILIIIWSWKVSDYRLWDIKNSKDINEFQPELSAKAIALMYSWDGFSGNMRLQIYTSIFTSNCGRTFTRSLSESEKQKEIYDEWVKQYDIDMRPFLISDWRQYGSVNDFFIRRIDLTQRPLECSPPCVVSDQQVVSPADSRLLIFPNNKDTKLWIKGGDFTVLDLLDNNRELADLYNNGTVVISRLAPQDYHRFHAPVTGKVSYSKNVDGTYWSVNPEAVMSKNSIFYNVRKILAIDTPKMGKVVVVAVGATCVGSVVIGPDVGKVVHLNDELGYMQFGGSTIVMLFQPNLVNFHPEIVEYSKFPVETYVQVNFPIGIQRQL